MRHTAVIVVVATLTAACTPPPSSPPDDVQAWHQAVPPALVPHPATDGDAGPSVSDVGRSAPPPDPRSSGASTDGSVLELRAADEVIRRLETEGLYVFDLTTNIENTGGRHAVVLVTVLYGSGQAHPHGSRYRVRLHRSENAWQVTGMQAAP
jgi:hypothetical protein